MSHNNIISNIMIIFQYIGLVILRLLYQPINMALVKTYGCGCVEGFNTNAINRIMFMIFMIIMIVITILNIRIFDARRKRIINLVSSIVVNIPIAMFIWLTMQWK